MTQRKEKGKGQAAGCVDTKSQRIPVRWCGTLFLQASPHVLGSKTATRASVTHRRNLIWRPTALVLLCSSPGCSMSGESTEETPGDGRANIWRWWHCTAHPRVTRVLSEHTLTGADKWCLSAASPLKFHDRLVWSLLSIRITATGRQRRYHCCFPQQKKKRLIS